MWKTGGCGGILPYDKAKVCVSLELLYCFLPLEIFIRMKKNSRFPEINYLLFVLALPFQIYSYFFFSSLSHIASFPLSPVLNLPYHWPRS